MTILNTEFVSSIGAWLLLLISGVFIAIGIVVVLLSIEVEEENKVIAGGFVVLIIGLIFFTSTILQFSLKDYTKYTVIFDEENPISAQEFLEKYEVLEVEGKIYTIREREAQE